MELKNYQQKILNDLERFLEISQRKRYIADAYNEFWMTNNPPFNPYPGMPVEPYKDNVPGAPHLCIKVPTGGGKTFIASAALKTIFDAFSLLSKRFVVWLVPSNAILEQTLRNLRNKQHPYRQRIDTDFQNRVEVFNKEQALMGQGFSLATVNENLCILVMSYDSFRTANKDNRRVYLDNGYLQSFLPLLNENTSSNGEVQLMTVIQALRPVVIVDESHNATSKLSEEMIKDMNPSFVLDLTATPRKNSNILCFTDALQLKKNNMVKLPVIVYNHHKKEQVIDSALHLQRELERTARKYNDRYIRPIVLFQAESKNGDADRATFDKIKQNLLDLRIPEEQIKIKTAEINEIKDIDLMAKDCPVRYIITINALKEGWDCPFAYILASLADRSSAVDVEQIVGRVLRLPNTRQNPDAALNMSYVLTASARFQETLNNVVKGLNRAGFSDNDYRAVDEAVQAQEDKPEDNFMVGPDLFVSPQPAQKTTNAKSDDIDKAAITFNPDEPLDAPSTNDDVLSILQTGEQEAEALQHQIEQQERSGETIIANELRDKVKKGLIKTAFAESAEQLELPKFYSLLSSQMDIFTAKEVLLQREHLLQNFKLAQQDTNISFAAAATSMYRVDIDAEADDHTPRYFKIDNPQQREYIMQYLRNSETPEQKIHKCASMVAHAMGKMSPLAEPDILAYVERILRPMSEEQLNDFVAHMNEYSEEIKKKILTLEKNHMLETFRDWLDAGKLVARPIYKLPQSVTIKEVGSALPRSLYTKEEAVNDFELEVINDVANLPNIEWWTRNVEKRGYFINGFINHYPDFIIKTKSGKIVLLETKGDHLDAEDKIKLGQLWASKCGDPYRYFMVYKERIVDGAYTKAKFIEILRQL